MNFPLVLALSLADADAAGLPGAARCEDPGPDAPVVIADSVTSMQFQGFDVLYTMPEAPVGVVFYFMGAGDLETELFANEQVATLWNLLGSEGFGVVATERTTPGGNASWDYWNSWSHNQDALRVDALRDELIATTPLEDTTPVMLTGFSDGSGMATTFSRMARNHGWPVFAVTAHNGAFGDAPRVPTLFVYTENDLSSVYSGLPWLMREMDRTGTLHDEIEIAERIVTPEVFLREAGWDEAKAQAMFDDMVAHGLVDPSGRRLVADAEMDAALRDWQRTSSERGVALGVSRARIVWAMHRYNSFAATAECNFVLDALP